MNLNLILKFFVEIILYSLIFSNLNPNYYYYYYLVEQILEICLVEEVFLMQLLMFEVEILVQMELVFQE